MQLAGILLTMALAFQAGLGQTSENDLWSSRSQASTLSQFTRLGTRLQHGEPCSWKAEVMRQSYTRAFLANNIYVLGKWMQKIVKLNKPLCNANKLTVCSKLTETCVCGEPYLAFSKHTQKYVNEDGICRWDERSACVLQDFSEQVQARSGINLDLNSKCREGTACRTHSTGQSCSSLNLVLEFLRSGTLTTNQTVLTEKIYSGSICSCQPNNGNIIGESDELESADEMAFLDAMLSQGPAHGHGRSKRATAQDILNLIPPYLNNIFPL